MSVKIALAGNPNSGKTTLFNALTGSNQFVGNWPGVTVEKKEGKLKGHKDVIINIVDGTNIERNLYLSTQLMELGIPVVMAVNMMDILEKTGDKIHVDKLSKKLGCEVIEISALKGTGIQKAAEKAVALAQKKAVSTPVHTFSEKAEEIISVVDDKLEGIVSEEQKRFFAIKLLEKDDKIAGQMKSVPEVSNEIKQMEEAFDDDTESIITNERYVYISLVWEQLLRYFLSSDCCISCSDHIRREDKMATFCVSLLLVCVIALVIKSMIRDKKNGKSLQCGCDCSKCGGHCH